MKLEKVASKLGIAPVALQELIHDVLEAKGIADANEVFMWEEIPRQYQSLIGEFNKFTHRPLWWANYKELAKEHERNRLVTILDLNELATKLTNIWYSAEWLESSPIRECWDKGADNAQLFPIIEETFEASVLFTLNQLANTNVGREVLLRLLENRLK